MARLCQLTDGFLLRNVIETGNIQLERPLLKLIICPLAVIALVKELILIACREDVVLR